MGIQGLLPVLARAMRDGHISDFRRQRVAVDTYVWLHKYANQSAIDIVLYGNDTNLIRTCLEMAERLKLQGLELIFVFDGAPLPAKQETDEERSQIREAAYQEAQQTRDYKACCRAVDITPEIAAKLIAALTAKNWQCIVSPYEADAQLGYLSETGYVDAVMSNDSDMVLHGCRKVIYDWDSRSGTCRVLNYDLIPSCVQMDCYKRFMLCCILAGCDYAKSIYRVGIKTAAEFVRSVEEPTVESVLCHIRLLNLKAQQEKYRIPPDYAQKVRNATVAFTYQWVYCPKSRTIIRKTALSPRHNAQEVDAVVGTCPPCDGTLWAAEVCRGLRHPETLATLNASKLLPVRRQRRTAQSPREGLYQRTLHHWKNRDPLHPTGRGESNSSTTTTTTTTATATAATAATATTAAAAVAAAQLTTTTHQHQRSSLAAVRLKSKRNSPRRWMAHGLSCCSSSSSSTRRESTATGDKTLGKQSREKKQPEAEALVARFRAASPGTTSSSSPPNFPDLLCNKAAPRSRGGQEEEEGNPLETLQTYCFQSSDEEKMEKKLLLRKTKGGRLSAAAPAVVPSSSSRRRVRRTTPPSPASPGPFSPEEFNWRATEGARKPFNPVVPR